MLEELGLDQEEGQHDQAGREFIEGLKIRTIPVGFGCYLHRSGKPEIIGLTRVHCTHEEIRNHCRYTIEESLYSRIFNELVSVRVDDFTIASLKAFFGARLCDTEKSVPLEMGYRMLLHLCEARPHEIEEFMRLEI